MKRYLYIGYQTWIKIKYQKKRYFLYILSFYVGLLLPAFCLANIRSVDRMFYFTTFKKMNSSVQIDWFSEKFDILFPEGMEYSIKAYKEENFKQWGDKYVSIIGIDEKYAYPMPDINGRMFNKREMKTGAAVCLVDGQCAKTYSYKVGDGILIRDKKCKIVGILNSSIYSGIVIPYQTMKDIYQNKEKIQFTGTFWGESNNLEKIADKGTKIIEKNDPKSELISTTTGMELYKNALTTKKQWRIVRGLIAMVALTFFALNESIVLIEKRDEEQGTVGIKLALGASRKEMRIEALLETFWITGIAVLLVIVTMNPLARMLQLDNVIVVDGVIIVEMITISLLTCGILARCSIKKIKLYPIALMLKMKETE